MRLALPLARPLAAAAAMALSACAQLPLPSGAERPTTIGRAAGPEIVVRFSSRGQNARTLLEQLAASCWLDGIVRGAQLIVDRNSGNVVIVGETTDLLAADFLRPKDGRSRIRLSGPVIGDRIKADKLVATLDRAVKTGQTTCPPIIS